MKEKEILEITQRIYIIREQKVMLDRDLAELYGVEVRAINQAVKRNQTRFPDDFCFKLDPKSARNTAKLTESRCPTPRGRTGMDSCA